MVIGRVGKLWWVMFNGWFFSWVGSIVIVWWFRVCIWILLCVLVCRKLLFEMLVFVCVFVSFEVLVRLMKFILVSWLLVYLDWGISWENLYSEYVMFFGGLLSLVFLFVFFEVDMFCVLKWKGKCGFLVVNYWFRLLMCV